MHIILILINFTWTPSIWLHFCFESETSPKGRFSVSACPSLPSPSNACGIFLWILLQGGWNHRNLEVSCLMFKLLCPLFSNLQGIHHIWIQHHNVMLVNYICSVSTANRISDLQFTKLCLPPSGFALWLIQGLLLNMCFVMKMKRKKKKPLSFLPPPASSKC